ncbi:MAG: acetyl/propionyl/methylcrotonyl-CoA carboxylase subunit alpha [Shewanella sp.]|nr:acetyl/propionyl/methylcrotonyl-CoA carboxylase subunit alpha [Shewanella sp.]MCF1439748.1 acetyl/propionyl/methylcrotonyl-CoA carboxylase subunit alpha [Shewanella sp.]MCF1459348.1 acetyl/propionyl/methylcrotonyl-CoA carboxylase subunit alpha [Shewanella sp.]
MLTKLVIANRGEIACRVIRTARAMGINTVALYSDADANARHVTLADEAFYLGPSAPDESYLRGDIILQIAKDYGADAIHPGYGFLSENAEFARSCEQAGVRFIGPGSDAIDAMGSKSAAKTIMEKAGVPLVPGYHGDNQSDAVLLAESARIGYPQLIKAAFGGGGKGMRVVESAKEINKAIDSARREARSAFGNDKLLIERYLRKPRHVEVQVFADTHSNCVYLSDRDCSVQRRHQKVIEEAPAPGLSDALRKQMGEAAVAAARAIDYVGAGTVEFLLDTEAKDDNSRFFFMEMNTRLQVEHPVTEMITGQDLVRWQLLVAAGKPLPLIQEEIRITGHAFESRIYAEDPANHFLPASGTLSFLREPAQSPHVRIDSGVRQGDEISNFYDPMIAKLITWDEDRSSALARMASALDEFKLFGLKHNIGFLGRICRHPQFAQAQLCTDFIERNQADLLAEPKVDIAAALPIAALYRLLQEKAQQPVRSEPDSPWQSFSGMRLGAPSRFNMMLMDDNHKVHELILTQAANGDFLLRGDLNQRSDDSEYRLQGELTTDGLRLTINGHSLSVTVARSGDDFTLFMPMQGETGMTTVHFRAVKTHSEDTDHSQANPLNAPMNGTVVTHLVEVGAQVSKGQGLMVMEAMKMEYSITAPADGRVTEFYFKAGELVSDGILLLAFEPASQSASESESKDNNAEVVDAS